MAAAICLNAQFYLKRDRTDTSDTVLCGNRLIGETMETVADDQIRL